jgi:2'-hydroxyisoflavone reductase
MTAAATASLEGRTVAAQIRRPSLKILILGGTNFVGPALVRSALARGHEISIFNRQRTKPWLFEGVQRLKGDRFLEIAEGLNALAIGRWDAVIDVTAYYPRLVEATCSLLRGRVGHYIVMSSVSAYASFKTAGLTEDAATRELRASFEEFKDLAENDWATYGGRKALCEAVAARHFPKSWTSIRATHIHGSGNADGSGSYWPTRFRHGGDILAPGDGLDPIQYIDVSDVADFIILAAEKKLLGIYNAAGPGTPTTLRQYLEAVKGAVDGTGKVVWYGSHDDAFRSMPLYAPRLTVPGFHTFSTAKARSAGLVTRPIEETVRSDWLSHLERRGPGFDFQSEGTGLSVEKENAMLANIRRAKRSAS